MRLSTSLIAVKRITSSVPCSDFIDIEQSAQLILEAEGVINPIVVRRTSLDSYEVVDGHKEYHAAVRAREIEPLKGEMIGAFIIEDDKEKAILEQVKLLRIKSIISPFLDEMNEIKKMFKQQGNSLESLINQVEEIIFGKTNLHTATKDEVEKALRKARVTKPQANAAWAAIEHWKKTEELTWDNLEKSTRPGKNKITGFAIGTYKKLQKIGDII